MNLKNIPSFSEGPQSTLGELENIRKEKTVYERANSSDHVKCNDDDPHEYYGQCCARVNIV